MTKRILVVEDPDNRQITFRSPSARVTYSRKLGNTFPKTSSDCCGA